MAELKTIKEGLVDLMETEDLTEDIFHDSHREMLAECKDDDVANLLTNCLLVKRPEVFKASIKNTIALIDKKLGLDKPVAFEEQQVIDAKDLKSQLDREAKTITKEINRIGKSCMIMGKSLANAKELLGSQAKFLEWTDQHWGMKKSQAYALIKAYDEFGQNPALELAPARVLRVIQGIKDETVKQQVIADVVQEIDKKGKVSIAETEQIKTETEILNNTFTPKPTKVEVTQIKDDGSEAKLIEHSEAAGAIALAYQTLEDIEGIQDTEEIKKPKQEVQTPKPVDLKEVVKALKAELQKYKDELKNLECKQVPYLAQFNNDTPLGKLGLPEGSPWSAAEMAHSRLVQVWTEDSSPKAYTLLNEALDALAEIV